MVERRGAIRCSARSISPWSSCSENPTKRISSAKLTLLRTQHKKTGNCYAIGKSSVSTFSTPLGEIAAISVSRSYSIRRAL